MDNSSRCIPCDLLVFLFILLIVAIYLVLQILSPRRDLKVEKKFYQFSCIALGHSFVVIGVLGAFLPLLPSTPFLLLASFFYSKGSTRFNKWLLNHPKLGPKIKEYQQYGVISLESKQAATLCILLNLCIPMFMTKMKFIPKCNGKHWDGFVSMV